MTRGKKTATKQQVQKLIKTHGTKKPSPSSPPPEQLLALGIGDANNLTTDQLRKFFKIADPKKEATYLALTESELKIKAKLYLAAASPKQLLDNALKMSRSKTTVDDRYYTIIRQKIREYKSELENVGGTIQNALEKFEKVLSKQGLTPAQKLKYQQCRDDLENFSKQLKKSGISQNTSKIVSGPLSEQLQSKDNWKKAALLGAGLVGTVLFKKTVLDSAMMQTWLSSTIPSLSKVDLNKKTTDMLNKLTGNRVKEWEIWIQTIGDPKGDFKKLKEIPSDTEDYKTKLNDLLLKWIREAPNPDEILSFEKGTPNFISWLLSKVVSGKERTAWEDILKLLVPVVKNTLEHPAFVKTASWTDEQTTRFTKALLGTLKINVFTEIKSSGVSGIIDRFKMVSSDKDKDADTRKCALMNSTVLKWVSEMPFVVAQSLALCLESKDLKDVEVLLQKFKVDSQLSVIHWLYNSPILGEEFTADSTVDKELASKQRQLKQALEITDKDFASTQIPLLLAPSEDKKDFATFKKQLEEIKSDKK
jgi:hypothetical protein